MYPMAHGFKLDYNPVTSILSGRIGAEHRYVQPLQRAKRLYRSEIRM